MAHSLTSFAALATGLIAHVERELHNSLEDAAKTVKTEAKRVIGTYDYNWTPLAASTLARKAADTPLLETGEMRDSIEHTVQGHTAFVGSNNDKAVWHELGTSKVPPRPFLQGAIDHKIEEIVEQTGRKVHASLIRR